MVTQETKKQDFQQRFFSELEVLFDPLVRAAHDPELLLDLLYWMGWDLQALQGLNVTDLDNAFKQVQGTIPVIRQFSQSPPKTLAELKQGITAIVAAVDAIWRIKTVFTGINVSGLEDLPADLFEQLLMMYIHQRSPFLFSFLELLTLIQKDTVSPIVQGETLIRFQSSLGKRLHLDRLVDLLFDPVGLFEKEYMPTGLPTEAAVTEVTRKLFPRLASVLRMAGLEPFFDPGLKSSDPKKEQVLSNMISFSHRDLSEGIASEVGATLSLVSTSDGGPGLFVSPFGSLSSQISLGNWFLKFSGDFGVQAILLKSNGIEVMSPTNSSQFRLACAFERANGAWPTFLLGSSEDSRLEIGSFKAGGEISGDSHRHCFGFEVKVPQVLLVIKTGGGDGFVKKVLPPDGLQSEFQAGIGWSSLNGFYFKGSASLVVNLSLHKTFGPVTLHSVYIGVGIGEGEALTIRIAMSGNVSLGPVSVTLERIGIQAGVDFPKEGGNLGPLQFNPPDFLGPRGLGLTVKAAGVTGGGYLSFDKANHLYSGALQLQFAKVGLDAIGFITTGGPDGFSLVININTKFTPPVQLSFGFMLVAVGGLIAINRSMSVEALQAGMLDGTLDSLLFPRNPVAQAPRIIQDLQRVLPAQDGRYVVGPMLRITWGAKSLVKIDLGLFFEFPNPLRMLLAGQLDVAVPHEDKGLIEFHAAILGLLDLGRKVFAIDTRIKEGSHIVGFKVLGDTALRLSWGEKPYFLLSMGGFHPKFPVPAVYPALPQPFHRLSLIFDELKFFHLSCDSYFAITSNSLQFGANAKLYVKLTKRLKVEGYLGYDTLIMFSPFFFEVGIRAGVAVFWKKRTLMGVALEFTLSGPRPWRAKGKGKIKILFFKISIGFDVTWGKKDPVLLDAISPMAVLQQALEEPASWGSQLLPHQLLGEALAPFEQLLVTAPADDPSSTDTSRPTLVMHPAGTLEIRQKEVPLGIRLDSLQNAPVTEANRVVIDRVTVGDHVFQDPDLATSDSSDPVFTPVQEHFAPCQFVTCPTDARLTKPAFELMDAGVTLTSEAVAYAEPAEFNEPASLEYESLVIDEDLTVARGIVKPARVMPRGVGKVQLLGNTAASRARRALRPFQSAARVAVKRRVRLAPSAYHLVEYVEATGSFRPMQAEDLRPYRAGRMQAMTRLEADQVLSAIHQQHSDRKEHYAILPATEVGS